MALTAWQRIKKLNYYSRLGLIGTVLVMLLLLVGTGFGFDVTLFFPEWYLNLLPIPFVFARTIASASYIGAEVDLFKENNEIHKNEKWGTGFGVLLGIALGVAMDVLNPLGNGTIGIIQSILLVVSCINTNGSLGNRISSCKDPGRRLPHERYTIGIFTVLGAALSIALLVTATAAAVSIVGVTSFFTGGAPLLLASIFFAATVTSQMASTGDYFSKTVTYIAAKYDLTTDPDIKSRVNQKSYEYLGAAAGVGLALVFAAVVITALAVTQPHLFAGILGVVAAAFIITTCVSVVAGIISRFGRWYGNYCDVAKEESPLGGPKSFENTAVNQPSTPLVSNRLSNQPIPKKSNEGREHHQNVPRRVKTPQPSVSNHSFLARTKRVLSQPITNKEFKAEAVAGSRKLSYNGMN